MTDALVGLRYEMDGAVARLILDRPEKRNALDASLIESLLVGVERAEADPAVRVVAIAGAGPDFCAGADLRALRDHLDRPILENLDDAERLGNLFLRLRSGKKPVVALVRGRALAGGCGLATACDLVVAAAGATFGYTEVRLGFVPALVMAILSRNVTEKRAFEMVASGEVYGANDFERFGLVNRVWPDDRFAEEAAAYLQALADRDAGAIRLCKRLLYRQDSMSFEAAIGAGAEFNVIARMTDELREGVETFLDRGRSRTG